MDQTEIATMSFFGMSFTLAMGSMLLLVPRKWAILPIMMATCFLTLGQQVNVVGLHFYVLRILIVFGWARLLIRGELNGVAFSPLDKLLLLWAVCHFIISNIRTQTWDGLVYQSGFLYTTLGTYFLFRFLIRDPEDIKHALKVTAFLLIPLALAMLLEKGTGRNLFAVFGGVPETTTISEGRIRAQGPFRHPIMAGTFGATLVPLFINFWVTGSRGKRVAAIGILCGTSIMLVANSSGPALSYLFCLLALGAWPFREHLRAIRWSILGILVSLHIVMKAPVWYLISKMSGIIGGHGWDRSYLIDSAIRHFGDWWLIGTENTSDWAATVMWTGKADITNQFIAEAITGGLLTMLLFILLITIGFRDIGRRLKVNEGYSKQTILILWGMGAALLGHAVAFLSVTYFDQTIVSWYLLLAMISCIRLGVSPVREIVGWKAANPNRVPI